MNPLPIWDQKLDRALQLLVRLMRHLLLMALIVYLFFCIASLVGTLFQQVVEQGGALSFISIKGILTDALLVLIILAIVRTLFIASGFDYALAFLEIGFVVLVRKMLLLETIPEETGLLLVLGIVAVLLFGLIIIIYHLKHRWKMEQLALSVKQTTD